MQDPEHFQLELHAEGSLEFVVGLVRKQAVETWPTLPDRAVQLSALCGDIDRGFFILICTATLGKAIFGKNRGSRTQQHCEARHCLKMW